MAPFLGHSQGHTEVTRGRVDGCDESAEVSPAAAGLFFRRVVEDQEQDTNSGTTSRSLCVPEASSHTSPDSMQVQSLLVCAVLGKGR